LEEAQVGRNKAWFGEGQGKLGWGFLIVPRVGGNFFQARFRNKGLGFGIPGIWNIWRPGRRGPLGKEKGLPSDKLGPWLRLLKQRVGRARDK